MSDRRLAFVYSPEIERFHYPEDCPFKTERAGLARSQLRSLGLLDMSGCGEIAPLPAAREDLEHFHSPAYLDELDKASRGDLTLQGLEMGLGGPDTPVFTDLLVYGAWACGGALGAADVLLKGEADIAFSLLGGFHHAMAGRAGGFCYVNDTVLACMRLAEAGKRVFYLDVDAHHGDGVQAAFYRRKDVLTVSLHESGKTLYPWSGFEDEIGEAEGLGFNVNVPLPAWTYDEAFMRAVDRVAVPLLKAYDPDVIVLELGMDTLAGDPLTHLQMSNNVVVDVMQRLLATRKPLLVLGGGGYHVQHTVRGWALAWRTCCAEDDADACWMALGGVMLGSTEWAGGLRDHELLVSSEQRRAVEPELDKTIERVRNMIFRHHGLSTPTVESCGSAAGDGGAGGPGEQTLKNTKATPDYE